MNLRKIVVGALILGGLVAYIRLVELPADEAKLATQQPLRGVSPQEFSEIVIVRDAQTTRLVNDTVESPSSGARPTPDPVAIAAVDRSKSWRLADVSAGSLDKGAINSVLSGLVGLSLETPIPAAERDPDLSVYGLKEPRVVVTVKRGETTHTVRFGALNEYVSKRYVGFGEDVYLVADGLFTSVDKARDQFRNRNPIDFTDSELATVTVSGPKGELAFASDDSYRWRMIRPAEHPASDAAIATLARALRNIRVADFVDAPEQLERYGLAKPKLSVKLEFRPGTRPEPLVLDIGNSGGTGPIETYLRVANGSAVFRLPSDPTETIVKEPDDFRERAIFRFSAERVDRVVIERPGVPTVDIARVETEWTVNNQPGDRPFVEQVVRGLAAVQAESFPPPSQVPDFATLTAKFTMTVRADKVGEAPTTYTLIIGGRAMDGQQETGYYGRVNEAQESFIVSSGTLKVLTPLFESLVKSTGEVASTDTEAPTAPVVAAQ